MAAPEPVSFSEVWAASDQAGPVTYADGTDAVRVIEGHRMSLVPNYRTVRARRFEAARSSSDKAALEYLALRSAHAVTARRHNGGPPLELHSFL